MTDARPFKILVVDDDEIKRYTIGRVLLKAGFEVVEAVSGEEGLRLARLLPDLIVLDIKLPDIDGFEVCRQIKADPATANIPILHMSATFTGTADRVHGLDSGADAYLTSSAEPQEWIATVKALLRIRQAEETLRQANRRLELLSEISAELLLKDDPAEFIDGIYRRLASHFNVMVYLHFLADSVEEKLRLVAHSGLSDELARRKQQLDIGQAVCGLVAQERSSRYIADVQQTSGERTRLIREFGMTAYACHPLVAYGRLVGTLSFGSYERTEFTADELALMRTVSDQVATAIERKRLEDELRERNEQLAEESRRKDEFLAMLGHELRNPLAAISGAVQLLSRPQSAALTKTATEIADRQVQHLTRLVDDLLDLSRITRGKIRLDQRLVAVHDVIRQAVDSIQSFVETQSHELTIQLVPQPLLVMGDPARLEQVVVNLLTNAAKYTEPGGRIHVSTEQHQDQVVVAVEDTGIGIAPDMLPRLFEMFSQVDQSLDRSRGGMGIGLTLVRRLVELHGGSVEASSEGLGKGSRFVVRLPMIVNEIPSAPMEVANTTTAPASPSTPPMRRILLVEDNRDAARMLQALLKAAGHMVEAVHDGATAVSAAVNLKPDVVLLDIGLPGLNGYEVASALRQRPEMQSVLLIALTGYGQSQDRDKAHQAGFDCHLVKPVDLAALNQLLGGFSIEHR